ncbi:MAG: F0F1 ATP synthase subunit delta [Hoeflea sp.]|uniref:F0F1 ATP synthase subunit delta n=1 Tax=Hoeflea sp. TaxID=1940281 RepID=UPI00272F2C7B|nr:F0F1 ATP synthase subunit delta [Hoeflea sp.]MDP2120235.1 F0F1 ATP synthase subunit delta [Hoeflea sp.]MDZ7599799.1 F0F1 ATP synthase subunit delta [Hoeflea sp.]
MADNSHLISGVAERYASSLYELASEAKSVDAVAKDLNRFQAMIDDSTDLRRLVESPVFSAEDQSRSIVALISKAGISGLVGNFLKVVARNRRLFAMPAIIRSYHETVARERGEVSADVTSAHALTPAQEKELMAALSSVTGKTVTLDVTVDASLLGGLIVKIGSRQVDTSLRTKLSTLKHTLKEVG